MLRIQRRERATRRMGPSRENCCFLTVSGGSYERPPARGAAVTRRRAPSSLFCTRVFAFRALALSARPPAAKFCAGCSESSTCLLFLWLDRHPAAQTTHSALLSDAHGAHKFRACAPYLNLPRAALARVFQPAGRTSFHALSSGGAKTTSLWRDCVLCLSRPRAESVCWPARFAGHPSVQAHHDAQDESTS